MENDGHSKSSTGQAETTRNDCKSNSFKLGEDMVCLANLLIGRPPIQNESLLLQNIPRPALEVEPRTHFGQGSHSSGASITGVN
jgi:hypothetical protein